MMKYQAGQSGNVGGRPKGSVGGRTLALASLDKMLARRKNQRALIAALENELQGNPVRFFRTVIMPLLPREAKLSFDHDGVIQWKSLLGGEPVAGEINPHPNPLPSQGEGDIRDVEEVGSTEGM
jgi:hypothetical protein